MTQYHAIDKELREACAKIVEIIGGITRENIIEAASFGVEPSVFRRFDKMKSEFWWFEREVNSVKAELERQKEAEK